MSYEKTLVKLMRSNIKYFVLTAENRGPIVSIEENFKDRFLDVGIAEQSMIGIAAGLALRGNIPIVHAIASFLTMRAFEFIRTDIGLAKLPVKLIGTSAGFLSEANGPTHQSIEDIGLMRSIPNINIFCPADENDLIKCIPTILTSPFPWYIRYNNMISDFIHEDFEIGKAEVIGSGNDLTIFTYGTLFQEAYKLKNLLEDNNKKIKLVNLRTIVPIDECEIIKLCKVSKNVVVIEDHISSTGLTSIISEILIRNKVQVNFHSYSLKTNFYPLIYSDILKHEKFSALQIFQDLITKLNSI